MLELHQQHYVLTVIYVRERQTFRLNGYAQKPFRARRSNKNLDALIRLVPDLLGSPRQYKAIEKPYLKQDDSSSCGPIIVLAFIKEFTGDDLFDVQAGAAYAPWMQKALVDIYVYHYRTLFKNGELIHATGFMSGMAWAPPERRKLSFGSLAKALTPKKRQNHRLKALQSPLQSKASEELVASPMSPSSTILKVAAPGSSEIGEKRFGRILSYRNDPLSSESEEDSKVSATKDDDMDSTASVGQNCSIEVEDLAERVSKITFVAESQNKSVYFNIDSPPETISRSTENKGRDKELEGEATEESTEETSNNTMGEGIDHHIGVLSEKTERDDQYLKQLKKNVEKPRRKQLRVGKPAKRFSDFEGKTAQRLLSQAWEYLNKYMTATSPAEENKKDSESAKWKLIHPMAVLLNPYPPIKKGKRTFESTMENLPDKQHVVFLYRDEESWDAMLEVFQSVIADDGNYRISKCTDWQSAFNAYCGKTTETSRLVAAPKNLTPISHARKVIGLATPGSPATPF